MRALCSLRANSRRPRQAWPTLRQRAASESRAGVMYDFVKCRIGYAFYSVFRLLTGKRHARASCAPRRRYPRTRAQTDNTSPNIIATNAQHAIRLLLTLYV
jgi:hypothetical protein